MEDLDVQVSQLRVALETLLMTLENAEELSDDTRQEMDRIYRMID